MYHTPSGKSSIVFWAIAGEYEIVGIEFGNLPNNTCTVSTLFGRFHLNVADVCEYQTSDVGICADVITGGRGISSVRVVGAKFVVPVYPCIVSVAGDLAEVTSVPIPSFALTVPELKLIVAEPARFALNTIVRIFPFEPLYPGFGTPPLKSIIPSVFENEGFSTHRGSTEPAVLTDWTLNKSEGKDTTPSVLLIGTFSLFTKMDVVTVSFSETVDLLFCINKIAASV